MQSQPTVWIAKKWSERLKVMKQFASVKNVSILNAMIEELVQAFVRGNKVLACGNGGSACDAVHFCEELTGRYGPDRPAMPAIPLLDGSHITCTANDYGFDAIFSRSVQAYGNLGDVLVAISTSGNSTNVIKAIESAKKHGMLVLCLLGKTGGKIKGMGDLEIIVKSDRTEIIQEVHIQCLHTLIEGIEKTMYPELYSKKPKVIRRGKKG